MFLEQLLVSQESGEGCFRVEERVKWGSSVEDD